MDRLLQPLDILGFDETAAETFGRIVAYLQARGQHVGDMDALIAAVAPVNGHSIVTANERHFAEISALEIVTY